MKKRTKWICMILTVIMLFMLSCVGQAKDINVTKKMSSDAKIKRITRLVAYYTDAEVIQRVKKGKTVKEKMDDANILSMSAYMGRSDHKGTQWTKKEIQILI